MEPASEDPVGPERPEAGGCTAAARLGAELQALRRRTGKSLKRLEELVHVSDSSMSRYLSGRIVPPWPVIERLCRLAGEDPYRLRPLWEHLDGERHRQGRCAPEPSEAVTALPAPLDVPEKTDPPLRWHRRRPRTAVAALTVMTAVVFGGLGLVTGRELAPGPRVVPAAAQDDACTNWTWPTGTAGRAAIPPATVHGQGHAPVVRLLTGTVGGRPMAWAQITGARYGDRVWLDWSRNNGQTWIQCGPFTTTTATFASRAHEIGTRWRFRACGDTPRAAENFPRDACTGFW
ncbi:hypothetical protein GCM10023196_080090 [Actinoallomurus vinaceus]|uniref:HTH cro/C1-type domain-containing protein n=1 Tax=Actinoallomurus vinaceus TaxID=1080074 RepID=A0ABP8UN75_9ACTN